MKLKDISLCFLTLLSVFTLTAQDLSRWQWVKRGGGPGAMGRTTPLTYAYEMQRVVDMAIDSEDNYYFLTILTGNEYSDLVDYDGKKLHTYNDYDEYSDIYMVSTDSAGNFRWDKMIGGGWIDMPISINVDAADNIYISGITFNSSSSTSNSTHFDTDTIKAIIEQPLDQPDPMNKNVFLIKYDRAGNFQWLREPEGVKTSIADTSYHGGFIYVNSGLLRETVVEPDGDSHNLMMLGEGTYFNGQLTVPLGELQSVIVRYDSTGALKRFIKVDMKNIGDGAYYGTQMAYDAGLDRYYIADRQLPYTDTLGIGGYGGATPRAFYLAAVDNQGEVIWYKDTQSNGWNYLGDLQLDAQGNIYFCGQIYKGTFAGHKFPDDHVSFITKFSPNGRLLWASSGEMGNPYPIEAIALDTLSNSVYVGMPSLTNEWGDMSVPGPYDRGMNPDPVIVRLDATTGKPLESITIPDTYSAPSSTDGYTALQVDSKGNLVGGGYFGGSLFYRTALGVYCKGISNFFMLKYKPYSYICSTPEDFAIEKIDNTSVKLSWTPVNGESQWVVNYGDDNTTYKPEFFPNQHMGLWDTITGSPELIINNLEANRDYLFFVRAVCDSDHESNFSKRHYFRINDLSTDSCAVPQHIHIDSIGSESAYLFWTPADLEEEWLLKYGEQGFDPQVEGHRLIVSGSPDTTLTNLKRSTDYEVYIRVHCETYNYSEWTGPESFVTKDMGVEDHNLDKLVIYPNPTTGLLHIESPIALKDYKLYNLRGQSLKSGSLLRDRALDFSDLSSGIYILRIQSASGNIRHLRVVKK